MNPFDLVDDVSWSKKDLMSTDREEALKTYSPWLTNKALSYHVDSLMYANDMNVLHGLDPDMQHKVLLLSLKPQKRYAKWSKPGDVELVDAVCRWYSINRTRAREVIRVIGTGAAAEILDGVRRSENEGAGRSSKSRA